MDVGQTTRPVTSTATTVPTRLDAAPVRDSVSTELAPEKSVTASSDASATRVDLSRAAQTLQDTADAHDVKRGLEFDRATNEVVFKATDTKTGEVVAQYPEQALLNLRAYVRGAENPADGAKVERRI